MSLVDEAAAFYAILAALAGDTQSRARARWRALDPDRLIASWNGGPADYVYLTVANAQLIAARAGAAYVANALGAQGAGLAGESALIPDSLAGIASDGRDLDDLLLQPIIATLRTIADGAAPAEAMTIGEASLDNIVATQVADMGRAATDISMSVEPQVTGWVRLINPGACGRCVILAGRFYRWSEGFERHPSCLCTHIPSVEDVPGDLRTDPQAYFKSLSTVEQDRSFGKAAARAIRDGADMNQVVNARRGARGLSQPGRLTDAEQRMLRGGRARGQLERVDVYGRKLAITTEGTTIRGIAGKRLGAQGGYEKRTGERLRRAKTPRLMPEAIAEIAGDNRDELLRLYKRFGYII